MESKKELNERLEKMLKHAEAQVENAKNDLILEKKKRAEAERRLELINLNNHLAINLDNIESGLIDEAYGIING